LLSFADYRGTGLVNLFTLWCCVAVNNDDLETIQQDTSANKEQQPEQQPEETASDTATNTKTDWTHSMTLLLLELYRNHRTQFRSAKHMRNVWQKICDKMSEEGYNLTWQLCEKKFRNMKATFKDIKDNNRQSGRGKRKWPYYEILNELLGSEPAINPTATELGSKEVMPE